MQAGPELQAKKNKDTQVKGPTGLNFHNQKIYSNTLAFGLGVDFHFMFPNINDIWGFIAFFALNYNVMARYKGCNINTVQSCSLHSFISFCIRHGLQLVPCIREHYNVQFYFNIYTGD